MSKDNQEIIVVERVTLFGNNYFEGFMPAEKNDYEKRILSNINVMRRGDAETNPNFKQPIGYVIVMNPLLKKVFAYQRSSKDEDYGEKRLQGKWSWGFGGHVEPSDTKNGNPIRESMLREITQEELEIFGKLDEPEVIGYINDDSDSVGQVHFGILYLARTDSEIAKAKDSEIARVKLCSLKQLEEMCSSTNFDIEGWSQIAMEPLRKLF